MDFLANDYVDTAKVNLGQDPPPRGHPVEGTGIVLWLIAENLWTSHQAKARTI